MLPRLVESVRGARGWVVLAALLAAAPKCVLCLLAYTGLAAALGFAGPELCGAPAGPAVPWLLLCSAAGALLGAVRFRRS